MHYSDTTSIVWIDCPLQRLINCKFKTETTSDSNYTASSNSVYHIKIDDFKESDLIVIFVFSMRIVYNHE